MLCSWLSSTPKLMSFQDLGIWPLLGSRVVASVIKMKLHRSTIGP